MENNSELKKQTFQSLVDAVEENNRFHDAKWSDWQSAAHIQGVYGTLGKSYNSVAEAFLNALIRDNGENLDIYLDAMDALEYGSVFARPKRISP